MPASNEPVGRSPADDGGIRRATGLVVTCEHGDHVVPREHAALFDGAEEVLRSHRGWDPGSRRIAEELAGRLGVAPIIHDVTRLLVDANRSLDNPTCFSEFTRGLARTTRDAIVHTHYLPHRRRVEAAVAGALSEHGRCLHLAVHTFTPTLDGMERTVDVGLLFDPARLWEERLARRWRANLLASGERWRVGLNDPYLGTDDGLTTSLRLRHGDEEYAGIEIEIGQAVLSAGATPSRVADRLVAGLGDPAR